ncbi:MAG: TfuA-like protein [Nitrososphaeraceae archaeon]
MLNEDKTIILIDGVFLQDYPPTPIEVYQVVTKKNFIVFGASSIGALRAVELEKFGMKGYGKVFELYKKNIINSDDEVAVTFDDEYNLISEAMIDIRYNLFLSYKEEIITKETKKIITKIAKQIYFPDRSYDNIINKTIEKFPNKENELIAFEKFIKNNRKSLKEIDAIRLLHNIANT